MVAVLVVVIGIIVHSARTIRSPVARAQLHWMALGFLVGFGGYIGSFWAQSLVTRPNPVLELARNLSLPVLPLAFIVALLFYRLFDIDVIINRALVYALVTLALTVAFNASVWLLQQLSRVFIGVEHDVTIVLSTLAIAALFFPIRRAAQTFVDRRFYRQKYDAARTLGSFGASIRDEVDLDAVSERLVDVARETMQPTTVSIWIKRPSR